MFASTSSAVADERGDETVGARQDRTDGAAAEFNVWKYGCACFSCVGEKNTTLNTKISMPSINHCTASKWATVSRNSANIVSIVVASSSVAPEHKCVVVKAFVECFCCNF